MGVPQDDFSRAVMKLREQGYPKQKFAGIGDVFQRNGLVSSPTEERIRFMHALSQELSATITQIDGVLSARVHIVLPNNNPFGDTIQPSSASVFVRHRPGIDLTTKIPEMTRLVVGSIEGLEYDKVSTVLFAAEEVQVPQVEQAATTDIEFLSITVGRDSLPRLLVVAGALLLITVTSVIALIVTFIRSRVRITPKVAVSARNATARPMTA